MKTQTLRFRLIIFLLLCYFQSFSQTHPRISFSEMTKSSKYVIGNIIDNGVDGFLVCKYYYDKPNYELYLDKYDPSLHLVKTQKIEYTMDGQPLLFGNPFSFNDHIYAFGYIINSSTNETRDYLQQVDQESLAATGTPLFIKSAKPIANNGVALNKAVVSPNNKMLALFGIPDYPQGTDHFYNVPGPHNNSTEVVDYSVSVFNSDLKLQWQKDINLKIPLDQYEVKNALVDNDGNFFAIAKIYPGKSQEKEKQKEDNTPKSHFALDIISNKGDYNTIEIALSNLFVVDCNIRLNATGNVICSGFYSDRSVHSVKGTFTVIVDAHTGQILSTIINEFTPEFLQTVRKYEKTDDGQEVTNIYLTDFLMLPDGGFYLLGEDHTSSSSSTINTTTQISRTTNYSSTGEIIVCKFDNLMKPEWSKAIYKFQSLASPVFVSYSAFVKDDVLYLIYSDKGENMDVTIPQKLRPYTGENSIVVIVSVNPDGNWRKSKLFDSDEKNMNLIPSESCQISNNEWIFYGVQGWKIYNYTLGKITFMDQ